MPFAGFESFSDCMATMTEEEGHDQQAAENICGALQAEAKADHGNVAELRQALERGAGLIADVGVDLVSGVDVPAVDSKWVMTKSGGARKGHDYRAQSPILLAKDDDPDQRISYAAAMIPREPDKEGDVVATPTVEQAAHDFLKSDGGVDTDHSLIDGEGEVVESWILKEERTFDLPGGTTETYGAGTWMVGIEWGPDAWERITAGDLSGLSIYGMAEHIPLERAAADCGCPTAKDFVLPFADESVVNVLYASRAVAAKAARRLGFDGDDEAITHPHEFGDVTQWMPAPSHEAYVDAYNEFADADGFGPVDEDGEVVSAAAKADGPCWEGYTMVGTDEQGHPRCVPDDDVPDANLEDAVTRTPDMDGPPATHKAGETEPEDMAPDATDAAADGDDPTLAEVAASVNDLAETVATLKDDIESKQPGGDLQQLISEFTDRVADLEDIDRSPDAIKADLKQALRGKATDEDEDEDDDEDDEMGASLDGKEVEMDTLVDLMAELDEVAASADEIADALGPLVDGGDEMAADADVTKRAAEANLAKGGDARGTAAAGIDSDDDTPGDLSYRAVAEQEGDL